MDTWISSSNLKEAKTAKKQHQQQRNSATTSICINLICLLLTIIAVNANPNPSASGKSNSYHDSSSPSSIVSLPNEQQQSQSQQEQQKAALEAELNSIVQQHDALEGNNKLLAEAIISRLMVDNLTGSSLLNKGDFDGEFMSADESIPSSQAADSVQEANQVALLEQAVAQQQNQNNNQYVGPTGSEAMRLKKLLSFLQNYENNMGVGGAYGGQMFSPFPLLPAGQASTMKRAAMKMGAYLQPQRHLNSGGYQRNSFDFGLGKRPDSSISSNILRLGDSMSSAGVGTIQPLTSFGKRPSAHRFDFGLGKRVASPAYPRYDFGLGKRAPNRIRYDFGLGRK